MFATARKASTISDLAELGIETLSLEVDQPEQVERCKDEVEKLTGGGLDYLVNNAGRSALARLSPLQRYHDRNPEPANYAAEQNNIVNQ